MDMTSQISRADAGVNTGFFANIVENVRASMRRRRVYRETMNELSQLNTRELDDLGLSRSMLKSVAIDAARNA